MGQIIVNVPDELMPVHEWFQQQNGAEWADHYVAGKLTELKERKRQADVERLVKNYEGLEASTKATFDTALLAVEEARVAVEAQANVEAQPQGEQL